MPANTPIHAPKELESFFEDGVDVAALVLLGEDPLDTAAALPTVPPLTEGRLFVLEVPIAALLKAAKVSPLELLRC